MAKEILLGLHGIEIGDRRRAAFLGLVGIFLGGFASPAQAGPCLSKPAVAVAAVGQVGEQQVQTSVQPTGSQATAFFSRVSLVSEEPQAVGERAGSARSSALSSWADPEGQVDPVAPASAFAATTPVAMQCEEGAAQSKVLVKPRGELTPTRAALGGRVPLGPLSQRKAAIQEAVLRIKLSGPIIDARQWEPIFEELKTEYADLELFELGIALLPAARSLGRTAQAGGVPMGAVGLAQSGELILGGSFEVAGHLMVQAEQAVLVNAMHEGMSRLSWLLVSDLPSSVCGEVLLECGATRLYSGKAGKECVVLKRGSGTGKFAPFWAVSTEGSAGVAAAAVGGVQGGSSHFPSPVRLAWSFGEPQTGAGLESAADLDEDDDSNVQLVHPDAVDKVWEVGLAAATLSYVPYTQHYAGASLELASGDIWSGSAIENAAPSVTVSPLEAALVQMASYGVPFDQIKRVVLVEAEEQQSGGKKAVWYSKDTLELLHAIAPEATLENPLVQVLSPAARP